MTAAADARVLVVDDEREVADAYAVRIGTVYEAAAVYSGESALEAISEATDVVLLDRRMPGMTGDEVLERIRERGIDCQVIMLTAIDPGFDTIGMPFDDYLCKPVERDDLLGAIEQQLRIVNYRQLSEYFELAAKRAVLEAATSRRERETNEEYTELVAETRQLRSELADSIDDFEDIDSAFAAINREPA